MQYPTKHINPTKVYTITDGIDSDGRPVPIKPSRVRFKKYGRFTGMATITMLVDSGFFFVGKRSAYRAYYKREALRPAVNTCPGVVISWLPCHRKEASHG